MAVLRPRRYETGIEANSFLDMLAATHIITIYVKYPSISRSSHLPLHLFWDVHNCNLNNQKYCVYKHVDCIYNKILDQSSLVLRAPICHVIGSVSFSGCPSSVFTFFGDLCDYHLNCTALGPITITSITLFYDIFQKLRAL